MSTFNIGAGQYYGSLGTYQDQNFQTFNSEESLITSMMEGIGGGVLGPNIAGRCGCFGFFGGGLGMMPMLLGILLMLLMILEQQLDQAQDHPGFPGRHSRPPQYPPPGNNPYPSNYENGGTLQTSGDQGGPITYTDHNGWKITIQPGKHPTVTITSPDGHTITESGDPHEAVDGRQGQNGAEGTWTSKDRVIELPDGTVIDINASANDGGITSVNIFDGSEEVNVNAQTGAAKTNFNAGKTRQDESELPTDNMARVGWPNGQFGLFPMRQGFNPSTQVPAQQHPQAQSSGAGFWGWLFGWLPAWI